MGLRITIGCLGRDEAARIGRALQSFFAQSLFERLEELDARVDLIVVANGCGDDTAEVARRCIDDALARTPHRGRVRAAVHDLAEAGKINALNRLVHEWMDPATDYFFGTDADIEVRHPDTFLNMLGALEASPEALVATSLPLKHFEVAPTGTLRGWLSVGLTQARRANRSVYHRGALCGQLYCARASFMRAFRLPRGGLDEDIFIGFMARSDLMRAPEDAGRVRAAKDATHVFEAYHRAGDILKNLIRKTVAHQIFLIQLRELRRLVAAGRAADGAEALRLLEAEDPDWLRRRVADHIRARRPWVLEAGVGHLLKLRFGFFAAGRPASWPRLLPPAVLASCVDLAVLPLANRRMKSYGDAPQRLWAGKRAPSSPPPAVGPGLGAGTGRRLAPAVVRRRAAVGQRRG